MIKFKKYIAQKDDYTCSPTAIINLISWATGKAAYNENRFNSVKAACKTTEEGTLEEDFEFALKLAGSVYGFEAKKITKIEVSKFIKHLEKGNAFVITHLESNCKNPEWHDSIITGYKWGFYWGWNVIPKKLFWIGHLNKLTDLIYKDDGEHKPEIYLISKTKSRKDPLHVPYEKLTVYYKNKPQLILNKELLDSQNCWENLYEIKKLHLHRLKVEEAIANGNTKLLPKWTEIQFKLQKAWKFPEDAKYHAFWTIPGCNCPKMDNNDRYPLGNYIVNEKCKIHGKNT